MTSRSTDRPLEGRSIVVTRPRAQARSLVAGLEALGAEVIPFPTIRIEAALDREPLLRSAREVDGFDWVVFTSANGVAAFCKAMEEAGRDAAAFASVAVCAIGPATATALQERGVSADLVPERYVAEPVAAAIAAARELRGSRILLPRAELARAVLPDDLRARGAEVVEVTAYRTVPDTGGIESLRDRLRGDGVDMITFASGSAVRNFAAQVGAEVGRAEVAAIGPITSATAAELGFRVAVEADEYTAVGLIRAIRAYYAERAVG